MQQGSFFQGCNYSNRDITTDARTDWSLSNVDDTFSLLYCDLYLRQLKETLKHTMLVHESVFASQIHELHRLYWRQKELMMEMEGTQHHHEAFPSVRPHWINSTVSTYQTMNLPCEDNIPNPIEAVVHVEKPEKKVFDLELPVFEYNDRGGEEMNGELHETLDLNMSLESDDQSNNTLQHFDSSSRFILDLNEPAKIEDHSDSVFNQLSSPLTSNEIGEESYGMNEAQGQPLPIKCQGVYGIDLNMSPLSSEEEVAIVKEFETENPQESLSVSLNGKHRSEQPRVVVQALPCSNSVLLLDKRYKRLMRGSRPRKLIGPRNKTIKGSSDLEPHSCAQAISESHSDQASMEKGSSSSLFEVKSARNRTSLGKKRRCKPQMKSSNDQKVVVKKSVRTKRKKSRRISLVTEGNYQEISAAEAIVDMSRKSGLETYDCIASLSRDLLWFAEISSSVVEDYKLDYFEAMTLQLTEMKREEENTILRMNSSDNKTAVSSIFLGRQRRSRTRQGKRKCKDDKHVDISSLGTFSECETDEDLQVIENLMEASESEWDCGFFKNKSKRSAPKLVDAFTFVEEKRGVDWGAIKKQRRGSRIPAAEFQHMIINQVV